jgi:Ca2+-transporting ATPase
MVGGQIMIIFVGGKAFSVVRLNGAQWAYSIVLGFLSLPIGVTIRLIPDELILQLVPESLKNRSSKAPDVTVSDEEQHFNFPKPLADVKEELTFLKRFKGGRLNNLKFAMQHPVETFLPRSRSGSRSRTNSIPHTPTAEGEHEDAFGSPARTPDSRRRSRSGRSRSNSALGATTVMAGIIAGSIAGWSPIDRRDGDADSMRFPHARGRSELENREGVEIHPDTKKDDPVIVEDPSASKGPPSQNEELTPAAADSNPDKNGA